MAKAGFEPVAIPLKTLLYAFLVLPFVTSLSVSWADIPEPVVFRVSCIANEFCLRENFLHGNLTSLLIVRFSCSLWMPKSWNAYTICFFSWNLASLLGNKTFWTKSEVWHAQRQNVLHMLHAGNVISMDQHDHWLFKRPANWSRTEKHWSNNGLIDILIDLWEVSACFALGWAGVK